MLYSGISEDIKDPVAKNIWHIKNPVKLTGFFESEDDKSRYSEALLLRSFPRWQLRLFLLLLLLRLLRLLRIQ